jgi:hypothetical protein
MMTIMFSAKRYTSSCASLVDERCSLTLISCQQLSDRAAAAAAVLISLSSQMCSAVTYAVVLTLSGVFTLHLYDSEIDSSGRFDISRSNNLLECLHLFRNPLTCSRSSTIMTRSRMIYEIFKWQKQIKTSAQEHASILNNFQIKRSFISHHEERDRSEEIPEGRYLFSSR